MYILKSNGQRRIHDLTSIMQCCGTVVCREKRMSTTGLWRLMYCYYIFAWKENHIVNCVKNYFMNYMELRIPNANDIVQQRKEIRTFTFFLNTSATSQMPQQQSLLWATFSEMQMVLSSIGQINQGLEKLNILGGMNVNKQIKKKNTEEFNYTWNIVEQRLSDIDVDRTLLMWVIISQNNSYWKCAHEIRIDFWRHC